jgi:YesN/AraC family two-component response regulator
MMPIMDGFQLLEHLKANTAYHQLPVIMLTARTELEDRLQALRIGVDDYLTKPFIQEELFARIANLLTNAKNRKAVVMEEDAALTATDDISQEWQEWLEEVENKVKDNIGNTSYTLDQLAFDMAIGKRQFARRIKELVGLTPGEYVKIIRFTKARELLESRQFKTVKAVCYSVGFKDVVNFSRQFKERFGKKPSEYL